MSNDLVVGSIRSNVAPPLTGGIYEALLDKAERERDEARKLYNIAINEEARATKDYFALCKERDQWKKESLEQARLLGMGSEREARLITERDHYKQALEEISTTIQEWLDSMVQEPAEDFIHAIKAWADKKLNNL